MQEYKNLPLNIVYRGLGGAGFTTVDTLKTGELIRNGVAFDIEQGDKMLIITGKYFPESYTSSLNDLAGMVSKHSQMRVLRDPVKNTYILLFLFITILIIFSASWLGFYLAKGITVPDREAGRRPPPRSPRATWTCASTTRPRTSSTP